MRYLSLLVSLCVTLQVPLSNFAAATVETNEVYVGMYVCMSVRLDSCETSLRRVRPSTPEVRNAE